MGYVVGDNGQGPCHIKYHIQRSLWPSMKRWQYTIAFAKQKARHHVNEIAIGFFFAICVAYAIIHKCVFSFNVALQRACAYRLYKKPSSLDMYIELATYLDVPNAIRTVDRALCLIRS